MVKKHFRIILTVISILVVCNVVTLTLLLTNDSKKHAHRPHKEKCFLKSKLDLTEEQSVAFDSIKMKYKSDAKELDKELKSCQRDMIMLVSEVDVDTIKMQETKERIILLQDALFQTTIRQYKEYMNVLDNTKQETLKELYLEMFRCKKDCRKHTKCAKDIK